MEGTLKWTGALLAATELAASAQEAKPPVGNYKASVARQGAVVPPRVTSPCAPGRSPFAGRTVTVLMVKEKNGGAPCELRQECEAASGAKLQLVQLEHQDLFPNFMSDLTNGVGKCDAAYAGALWLGALVAGGDLLSYDKFYGDPRFPQWNVDDVLPGPRRLLNYAGHKYMVANDHDGQVMYCWRDLPDAPAHRATFQERYGYPLGVPATWARFRDVAEYFEGKGLGGDGVPGHGLTIHLKVRARGTFHFMSFSAPLVIGPDNPDLYRFDPRTMKLLVDSPGQVRALKALVDLVKFGLRDMPNWDLGRSWDCFLAGHAALTFTWGDPRVFAQDESSQVKCKVGSAPMPGTGEYYSLTSRRWIKAARPNAMGNTTGQSWAGSSRSTRSGRKPRISCSR
jgi:multiple sugar transport system substrate-binding protein